MVGSGLKGSMLCMVGERGVDLDTYEHTPSDDTNHGHVEVDREPTDTHSEAVGVRYLDSSVVLDDIVDKDSVS